VKKGPILRGRKIFEIYLKERSKIEEREFLEDLSSKTSRKETVKIGGNRKLKKRKSEGGK